MSNFYSAARYMFKIDFIIVTALPSPWALHVSW